MQIRVTSLTAFNACAYSTKAGYTEAKVEDTYKGDMLNIAALSPLNAPMGHYLRRYAHNIDSDITNINKIKKILIDAKKYVQFDLHTLYNSIPRESNEEWFYLYQEAKLYYKYVVNEQQHRITWQPDIVYCDPQTNKRYIEDLKLSTHSRYSNEDMLQYDCQRMVYPFMFMEYFKELNIKEMTFRFQVWDKNNTKRKVCGEKVVTYEEAKAFTIDVVDRYLQSVETWVYLPNKNPKCFFCEFKANQTCPLWKAQQEFTF